MISASVSNVELYRRFRSSEDFPLDILLRQMRGETEPTEKMRAGTALHAYLEHADDDAVSVAYSDGYTFHFACESSIDLSPVRELRGQRVFSLSNGETIEVRGRVDALDGMTVDDHKLSADFDAARYMESYQWRLYLAIFGATQFRYNVFVGAADREDATVWTIRDFVQLTLHAYPEMERDIDAELIRYVDFFRTYMQPQQSGAAA